MANLTLSQVEAIRDEALEQLAKALQSESYRAADRSNTRNISEIRATLDWAERMITRLSRGGIRITGGTPI